MKPTFKTISLLLLCSTLLLATIKDTHGHSTIIPTLQQKIENILKQAKEEYKADNILAAVMESASGKVVAMANAGQDDINRTTEKSAMGVDRKFAEYAYEPGSVIKPLVLALALGHKRVTPHSWFKTYNGRMPIGKKRFVTDSEKFASLNATDIIVHSSNIGISQIGWTLSAKEFHDGLVAFGLTKATGIGSKDENEGILKSEALLENKLHRANSSYGYGMLVTFPQLLKAYNVFNNDGIAVTPHLYAKSDLSASKNIISKKTAKEMRDILKAVVQRGTGVYAQYPGLEIGGKTGTAHIAKNGRYVKEYHSSFYGFANDDKGHRYTIGVLVIRAKTPKAFYASQSAVPVFKKVVGALVEEGMLEAAVKH